jgi:hypothetical protein
MVFVTGFSQPRGQIVVSRSCGRQHAAYSTVAHMQALWRTKDVWSRLSHTIKNSTGTCAKTADLEEKGS